MALSTFFRRSATGAVSRDLYATIVAQGRNPQFYTVLGVPDTVDGRFELISLHAFLVLRCLKAEKATEALSQALFDTMFGDMDGNLREMGAGDLGVGRRVKTMAKAFYGRINAYEAGLSSGPEGLAAALARNLFGTVEPSPAQLAALAGYVMREDTALGGQDPSELRAGRVVFGSLPETLSSDGAAG